MNFLGGSSQLTSEEVKSLQGIADPTQPVVIEGSLTIGPEATPYYSFPQSAPTIVNTILKYNGSSVQWGPDASGAGDFLSDGTVPMSGALSVDSVIKPANLKDVHIQNDDNTAYIEVKDNTNIIMTGSDIDISGFSTYTGFPAISTSLVNLTDTNIISPLDNQILSYDNGTGKWINETPGPLGEVNTASNVGAGVSVFKQKTGVDLEFNGIKANTTGTTVNLVGNDIEVGITYGTTANTALEGNTTLVNTLNDITDVTLSGIATDDVLKWTGSQWENKADEKGMDFKLNVQTKMDKAFLYSTYGYITFVLKFGSYVLAQSTLSGMIIFDCIEPEDPVILTTIPVYTGFSIFGDLGSFGIAGGKFLHAVCYNNQPTNPQSSLCLWNIENITAPIEIQSIDLKQFSPGWSYMHPQGWNASSSGSSLFLSNSRIYEGRTPAVLALFNQTKVYEITGNVAPLVLRTTKNYGGGGSKVVGTTLLLAFHYPTTAGPDTLLRLIDISDPFTTDIGTSFNVGVTIDFIYQSKLYGGWLYTPIQAGLLKMNISNITAPTNVTTWIYPNNPTYLAGAYIEGCFSVVCGRGDQLGSNLDKKSYIVDLRTFTIASTIIHEPLIARSEWSPIIMKDYLYCMDSLNGAGEGKKKIRHLTNISNHVSFLSACSVSTDELNVVGDITSQGKMNVKSAIIETSLSAGSNISTQGNLFCKEAFISDLTSSDVLATDADGKIISTSFPASGETNTMSNVGTVSVYKQKTGVDFEMHGLKANTTGTTVNLVGNDIEIGMSYGVVANTALQGTVLDDTKGDGDTAYVWSANKVFDELATKEPTFSKNTAFNKNYGIGAGTVLEGNRIDDTKTDGDTGYIWSADKVFDQLATKEPTFSKNTAFNKNYGVAVGTVLEGDRAVRDADILEDFGVPDVISTFPYVYHEGSATNYTSSFNTNGVNQEISDGKWQFGDYKKFSGMLCVLNTVGSGNGIVGYEYYDGLKSVWIPFTVDTDTTAGFSVASGSIDWTIRNLVNWFPDTADGFYKIRIEMALVFPTQPIESIFNLRYLRNGLTLATNGLYSNTIYANNVSGLNSIDLNLRNFDNTSSVSTKNNGDLIMLASGIATLNGVSITKAYAGLNYTSTDTATLFPSYTGIASFVLGANTQTSGETDVMTDQITPVGCTTTASRITVNISGDYRLMSSINYEAQTNLEICTFYKKNGTRINKSRTCSIKTSGISGEATYATLLSLVATDYIEFELNISDIATVDVYRITFSLVKV